MGFEGPEFYIKSFRSTICLQVVNTTQLSWEPCKTKYLWVQSGDMFQKRIKLANTNYCLGIETRDTCRYIGSLFRVKEPAVQNNRYKLKLRTANNN